MSIKVFERLSQEDRKKLKEGVVQVTGKAMNRTALGIVHAIFELYPNITYAELKQMLPDSINMGAPKTFKHGYMPYTDLPYGVFQKKELVQKLMSENRREDGNVNMTHFTEPDEILKTSDGIEICVSRLWESVDTVTKENNLQNLINHVEQYGIKVVSFEGKEHFKKGGFSIEVINPVLLEKIHHANRKSIDFKSKKVIAAVVGTAVVASISLYYILRTPKTVKNVAENVIEMKDKIEDYKDKIEEIKDKLDKGEDVKDMSISFNNILFEYNSDKFLPESEKDLKEALEFLEKYPNIKVKIVGHTSQEGLEENNQVLSEKRAKAVKDYLVIKGIQEARLSYEGKGSKSPLKPSNDEESNRINRRTEFIIL